MINLTHWILKGIAETLLIVIDSCCYCISYVSIDSGNVLTPNRRQTYILSNNGLDQHIRPELFSHMFSSKYFWFEYPYSEQRNCGCSSSRDFFHLRRLAKPACNCKKTKQIQLWLILYRKKLASQKTSKKVGCASVAKRYFMNSFGEVSHTDVIKWKRFPRYWPFVRGIHRSSVNSPHKGRWRGALLFSLICAWINGWVNNREAGDLRRHRAHFDVTVMNWSQSHIA